MDEPKNRETYSAAEDTFLLADVLSKHYFGKVLEIGVGEGLVTEILATGSERLVGTDIDIHAIRKTLERLEKAGLISKSDLMVCDGAKPLRGKFDLCAFNPPYLPSEPDDITFSGGRTGIEVTREWFDQCSNLLNKNGRIIFVASGLAHREGLLNYIRGKGFETKILARKKLFFEEILIIQASI